MMVQESELKSHLVEAYRKTLAYSCAVEGGCRSSKRTDILNREFASFLFRSFKNSEDWSVIYEERIKCARATLENPNKTFSIDVIFTNKKTGRNVYVLLKSIESSYNKNKENFANCTVGEVERIYGHSEKHGDSLREERKNDVTLFFTLLPRECPVGTKAERTKYTKPSIKTMRLINENVHQVCAIVDCENGLSKKNLLNSLTGCLVNLDEVNHQFEEFFNNVESVL